MTTVQTATGPIDSAHLGFTLMHEHIVVRSPGFAENFPSVWNRGQEIESAVQRLSEARARGVQTIVDVTTFDLGRDIEFIAEAAGRSGMQVIVATGIWIETPRYFASRGPDEMAALFVRDIQEGIAGTNIKAGIIKCAADVQGVTLQIEKVLRGSARAQRATGVPITTHTDAASEQGTAQQDIFESEGVDLSRVIIGHSGDTTDIAYLTRLIGRGSYIGMDRFGIDAYLPTPERVATIARLCQMGHADKMVLTHDANCCMDSVDRAVAERTMPNWQYNHIPDDVIPALRAAGVSDEQTDQMMVGNPRRIFERCDPY